MAILSAWEPKSMAIDIQVVKGMKDTLPSEMVAWHFVEKKLKELAALYGYQEIRMPIIEQTQLFSRAIGEVTDIVEKEMYTFIDKGGDSLTIRPEGTAQCVRAVLENSLIRNQSQKLWYYGPMFRRENPQKGRYRQFYQFGVEAFGLEGPDIDVEQIRMMATLWKALRLDDKIVLQLNSIGTAAERKKYREALVDYFTTHHHHLDEDSQRRLKTNPMRILDSKNPDMKEMIENAPMMLDYLEETSKDHFAGVQAYLKDAQIDFQINPRLVRGLDYYTHTVYEWVTTALGAQGTVCAGGRYNDLVGQMGGVATPAVGFSLGVERLIMLLQENALVPEAQEVDIYVVTDSEKAQKLGFKLAETLRQDKLRVIVNCGGGSFKSQFKRADRSSALFAVVLGEQELTDGTFTLKSLRDQSLQTTHPLTEIKNILAQKMNKGSM